MPLGNTFHRCVAHFKKLIQVVPKLTQRIDFSWVNTSRSYFRSQETLTKEQETPMTILEKD